MREITESLMDHYFIVWRLDTNGYYKVQLWYGEFSTISHKLWIFFKHTQFVTPLSLSLAMIYMISGCIGRRYNTHVILYMV